MRRLIFLAFLLLPSVAQAVCPGTPAHCPSPTFLDITVLGSASFNAISNTPIGNPVASSGAFSTLAASGTLAVTGAASLVNNMYDIRASGAVCDGITDDASAINTWIATLSAGARVVVPATKQCAVLSADLTIPAGVTLEGQGAFQDNAGGSLLSGPAIVLSSSYTIVTSGGTTVRNLKILRPGLLASPTSGQTEAAVAAWAAEAAFLPTSSSTASGTVLPFADTTGVADGQAVYGDGIAAGTTVSSFVPNTSVTLSTAITTTVASGSYVRFGPSLALRVPQGVAGVTIDHVQIIGYQTCLMIQAGRAYVHDLEGDCTTVINATAAGDASYMNVVHAIPYYGFTSTPGTQRPGPAFYIGQVPGWVLSDATNIAWIKGYYIYGSNNLNCRRCWAEFFNDNVTAGQPWVVAGAINNVMLTNPVSAKGAYAFDLQQTNGPITILGAASTVAQDGTGLGHYRFGPNVHASGTIVGAMITALNVTPFVVESGAGRWKIASPVMSSTVPDPWISFASASDKAQITTTDVKTQNDTTNSANQQTRLNESFWAVRDTSVAKTDGSPVETIAAESTASGTAGSPRMIGVYRNGVRLGGIGSGTSNTSFDFEGDTSNTTFTRILATTTAQVEAGTKMTVILGGVNALNVQNHSTPSSAFVQVGADTTSGAYIAAVSAGNDPLTLSGAGTSSVTIGTGFRKHAIAIVSLPACSAGTKYDEYIVSDANAPTYGATIASGGAVVTPVVCDGTNWKAH